MGQYILAILTVTILGYVVNSSFRVISGGQEGLVERLGRYKRIIKPGLNFIIPLIEKVVYVETTRERVLDVDPQPTITKDNVALEVDAVVYWRIMNLPKAYYEVEDIEAAIANMVLTTLRSEIGQLQMKQTLSETDKINRILLSKLDLTTANWGVKIIRVEIQSITPPKIVSESMELERAAESEKQAMIVRAEGNAKSIERLAQALNLKPESEEFRKFLIAQTYVEANSKLSESANSKVIFMDPKALSEAISGLMEGLNNPP
ncbi:stomatin-like protein [Kamptonema sp. UHCC 0994]|uniref:SPFH domain-containing protein n=1 Tax=Kamptonema sp. UHCC 0994 TaxID=3031329 RepID=UPI0023BA8885|nr:stomatin-like protein [Kamptonema sp. UHCC 0994]MDF0557039.1 paraslipin [Kamptonema sp. UHCC 0994]